MIGSEAPLAIRQDAIRSVLQLPGVLQDLASAPDARARTIADWVDVIEDAEWASGIAVRDWVGPGHMVTVDRPLSEYFLVRRWVGPPSPIVNEAYLRSVFVTD